MGCKSSLHHLLLYPIMPSPPPLPIRNSNSRKSLPRPLRVDTSRFGNAKLAHGTNSRLEICMVWQSKAAKMVFPGKGSILSWGMTVLYSISLIISSMLKRWRTQRIVTHLGKVMNHKMGQGENQKNTSMEKITLKGQKLGRMLLVIKKALKATKAKIVSHQTIPTLQGYSSFLHFKEKTSNRNINSHIHHSDWQQKVWETSIKIHKVRSISETKGNMFQLS